VGRKTLTQLINLPHCHFRGGGSSTVLYQKHGKMALRRRYKYYVRVECAKHRGMH